MTYVLQMTASGRLPKVVRRTQVEVLAIVQSIKASEITLVLLCKLWRLVRWDHKMQGLFECMEKTPRNRQWLSWPHSPAFGGAAARKIQWVSLKTVSWVLSWNWHLSCSSCDGDRPGAWPPGLKKAYKEMLLKRFLHINKLLKKKNPVCFWVGCKQVRNRGFRFSFKHQLKHEGRKHPLVKIGLRFCWTQKF